MAKVRTTAGSRAAKARAKRIWRATAYRSYLFNHLDRTRWEAAKEEGFAPRFVRCLECGKEYRIESHYRRLAHNAKHTADATKLATMHAGQRWLYKASNGHTRHVEIVGGPNDKGAVQIRAFMSRWQWVSNLNRFIALLEE